MTRATHVPPRRDPASLVLDPAALEAALRDERVQLVPKSNSRLMAVLAVLLRAAGTRDFQARYWTTLGRTIYYPTSVRDPRAHPAILAHELVHVQQWARFGVLLWLSYLLLPLPFGLAWFRFRWEREAYLIQIAHAEDREREITRVVDTLWYGYGRPWPRTLMRRWFDKHA